MIDYRELVTKYLNEMEARVLSDGSLHPDDESEARAMARIEYLETRESEEAPGLVDAKKSNPNLEALDKAYLELWVHSAMERYKAGDFAVVDDVVDAISKALRNQITRDMNKPPGRPSGFPPPQELREEMNQLKALGVERSAAVAAFAAQYGRSLSSVNKHLNKEE
jgi:hypothetical protein